MRTKLLSILTALAIVWSFTPSAHAAAGGGTSTIDFITVYNGAQFAGATFKVVGPTRPVCHNNAAAPNDFAFDVSTTKGKAMLSLLQAAQLAGKTVGFGGTGTCLIVQPSGLQIEGLSIISVHTN